MSIREYIAKKKERFNQYREERSASRSLERQKEIVKRQQRIKTLSEERQDKENLAALKREERELRTPEFIKNMRDKQSSPSKFSLANGKSLGGTASKVQNQNVSRPSLFGNNNSTIGSGYRGPDFSSPASTMNFNNAGPKTVGGLTKKKKGYDPFGYRGLQ